MDCGITAISRLGMSCGLANFETLSIARESRESFLRRRFELCESRACSRSTSLRDLSAIAFIASNSSRGTRSRSFTKRSACVLIMRADFVAHALGGAGGVGHELRQLIENRVFALHRAGSVSCRPNVGTTGAALQSAA